MRRIRVIPTLLISNRKLVKTTRFQKPVYVGDPINTLKILNEKEVDEVCVLDIDASKKGLPPDMTYIRELASECFMPFTYGGGITSVDQAKQILKLGVEKLVFGTTAITDPDLVSKVSRIAGAQSVVVSIDVRKNWLGKYLINSNGGTKKHNISPAAFAQSAESMGVGEILLQDIDREGTFGGYNLHLIREVANQVGMPVIISGGASAVEDFLPAVNAGASAVAAGALFMFKGSRKAVLINYPSQEELFAKLYNAL